MSQRGSHPFLLFSGSFFYMATILNVIFSAYLDNKGLEKIILSQFLSSCVTAANTRHNFISSTDPSYLYKSMTLPLTVVVVLH